MCSVGSLGFYGNPVFKTKLCQHHYQMTSPALRLRQRFGFVNWQFISSDHFHEHMLIAIPAGPLLKYRPLLQIVIKNDLTTWNCLSEP
jgi:hypothetical protein